MNIERDRLIKLVLEGQERYRAHIEQPSARNALFWDAWAWDHTHDLLETLAVLLEDPMQVIPRSSASRFRTDRGGV